MSDEQSLAANHHLGPAGNETLDLRSSITSLRQSPNQIHAMTGRLPELGRGHPQAQHPQAVPRSSTNAIPTMAQQADRPWSTISPGPAAFIRALPNALAHSSAPQTPMPVNGGRPSYCPDSVAVGQRSSAETQVALDDMNHISRSINASAVRVSHLDAMLRALALNRNGVKKVKVERLLLAAQQYLSAKNFEALHHMRHVVDGLGPGGGSGGSQRVQPMTYTEAVNSISRTSPPSPAAAAAPNPLVSPRQEGPAQTPLSFQKSPFYSLDVPIANPMFFVRPYTRRRVQQICRFRVNPNIFLDEANRIYLVSQQFVPQAQNLRPVYFPFYVDITLDDQEVKANTRGVRGSVGSAKPVDLTSYLKAKPGGQIRNLNITVHISDQNQYETVSDKSFAMGLYKGRKTSFPKLMALIRDERPHFTIEQTKQQLHKAAADEEGIESTAMRFSLRDPIMRTRIKEPVRSKLCEHIDCFDAESFFMLQNQAETWKCPVCNRRITFESLLVDDFYMEILSNTPEDLDAVEIASDGKWSIPAQVSDSGSEDSSDDDASPPVSKRARTEPDVQVVDLLSDTDEEVPEPVKPVSPRGSFQSEQAPKRSNEVDTASQGQELAAQTGPNSTRASGPVNEGLIHKQQTGSGAQTRPQNGQAGGQDRNSNKSHDAPQNSQAHAEQPRSIDQSRHLSHSASPDSPTQPPEPRFQIAQLLQSFRASNSVLFEKSLPYPAEFSLLQRQQDSEQGRTKERPEATNEEQESTSVVESPSGTHRSSISSPATDGESWAGRRHSGHNDLFDDDVIDLTGDD